MRNKTINRKEFIGAIGKMGIGTCMCTAAAGMRAAFGSQTTQTKPGDKTVERTAKRMEFGDIWVKRFFDVLDKTVDEATRTKLMMENGKACFIDYAGPSKQKPGPDALDRFTKWVVKNGKQRGKSLPPTASVPSAMLGRCTSASWVVRCKSNWWIRFSEAASAVNSG